MNKTKHKLKRRVKIKSVNIMEKVRIKKATGLIDIIKIIENYMIKDITTKIEK